MSDDSVGSVLEKHWSVLSLFDREVLLRDLGIDGKNEEFLGGKTMDQIIQSGQDDLPAEVRGRLIMAVMPDGFSKKEYERVRDGLREAALRTSTCERGN